MESSPQGLHTPARNGARQDPRRLDRHTVAAAHLAGLSGTRSRSHDSWVEISSQPSSSSLSSAADDIVTEGLRVQHDHANRRRRRFRTDGSLQLSLGHRASSFQSGGSSQEEYDESESESDRVMSSSNEGPQPSPLRHEVRPSLLRRQSSSQSDNPPSSERGMEVDDEDESSTAISVPLSTHQYFAPQPNAFSHPPNLPARSPPQHSSAPAGPEFSSRPPVRPSSQRHSYPSQPHQHPRTQHNPYNVISPAYQADHDAALRASLSTLLSCAAAARGLPKSNATTVTRQTTTSTRVVPSSLRLVPESVALGTSGSPTNSPAAYPDAADAATTPSPRSRSSSPVGPTKRGSGTQTASNNTSSARSSARDPRPTKKARRTGLTSASGPIGTTAVDEVSPTLLTWVLSAGVVVLVSALSFSAGFVAGREAARAEMGVGGVNLGGGVLGAGDPLQDAGGACGKEVWSRGLGLKKLRWGWGDVGSVSVRA